MDLTVALPVRAHLRSAGDVVIFPDVKLADWASRAALQKPLVDALSVEEVETWHRTKLFVFLVFN